MTDDRIQRDPDGLISVVTTPQGETSAAWWQLRGGHGPGWSATCMLFVAPVVDRQDALRELAEKLREALGEVELELDQVSKVPT